MSNNKMLQLILKRIRTFTKGLDKMMQEIQILKASNEEINDLLKTIEEKMNAILEKEKSSIEFHAETTQKIAYLYQEIEEAKIVIKENLYDTAVLKARR